MALSKFDGWVGDTLLRVGDEYPDDHDLVKNRPEMFDVEQAPEKTPEQTERKRPGPKPGSSRTKPQT